MDLTNPIAFSAF